MTNPRYYHDAALNPSPHDRLEPVWTHGNLTGLQLGKLHIPRPVMGCEHEHNIAACLPTHDGQMPDTVGIDFLLRATEMRGARSAYGRTCGGYNNQFDRGRLLQRGAGGMPVHVYDDLSKFEVSFGEFTSAKKLLAFRAAFVPELRAIVDLANSLMTDEYDSDPRLLLHLSGGDCQTTCATLHLNIPWADAISRAAYVSLEAFPHLQETLARQLAIMVGCAATGMPSSDGLLSDPRSLTFAQVVGMQTLEPNRAMQFNRLEGRRTEGFDQEGLGRNMQMLATWGQSQVANFLTLVLNQLETLRLHLAVVGLHQSPKLLEPHESLLTLSADLAMNRQRAAQLARGTLDDYMALTSLLNTELGSGIVEELVPDYEEALQLADEVVTAFERDDFDTLVRTTDYAKKQVLIDTFLSSRSGTWHDNLTGILNICFLFASPQEVSPYYSYFKQQGLETEVLTDGDLDQAGPDPATRSYFFTQIANRFWEDPALDDVTFDWDRLVRRRRRTLCGGWVPNIRVEEQIIEVPTPHGHNQAAVGRLFDTRIASVDELFEVFATRDTRAATVAAHH
jgi:hypothetical protein